MYSIVMITLDDQTASCFDSAEEAMKAVNRLRALGIKRFVIRDENGAPITEQQLAMIVMERRIAAGRKTGE